MSYIELLHWRRALRARERRAQARDARMGLLLIVLGIGLGVACLLTIVQKVAT